MKPLAVLLGLTLPGLASAQCPADVVQIARDMTLAHDAAPGGVPDSYDWQPGPRLGMGNDPGAFSAVIAWGQVYTQAGIAPPANTRVEMGPLRALILDAATGQWQEMHPPAPVEGAAYREDFVDDASVEADLRGEPEGRQSVRVTAGYNFHFWPDSGRVPLDAAGVGGVVVTMQARLTLDDPAGPDDRASARLMMSVGADYWQSLDADWPDNGDAAIGRFVFITPDWQDFTMTTLDKATLCANPPPL